MNSEAVPGQMKQPSSFRNWINFIGVVVGIGALIWFSSTGDGCKLS